MTKGKGLKIMGSNRPHLQLIPAGYNQASDGTNGVHKKSQ